VLRHDVYGLTNKVISMKTFITKSLLTSLCQREEIKPLFGKEGQGRFFNNDALLMNSLVTLLHQGVRK